MTAFVKCAGDLRKGKRENYKYSGVEECHSRSPFAVPNGGSKGMYTTDVWDTVACVKACPFDAIHVVNGVAVVDKEKCEACGKCVGGMSATPDRACSVQGKPSSYSAAPTDKGTGCQ